MGRGTSRLAETAAAIGDMKTVFEISRLLTGKSTYTNSPIAARDGRLLTSAEEQLTLWVEHFTETLNNPLGLQPCTDQQISPESNITLFGINHSTPTKTDVINAIKSQTCALVLTVVGNISLPTVRTEFDAAFSNILKRIETEKSYQHIYIHHKSPSDCLFEEVQKNISKPLITSNTTLSTYLKHYYNSEILVVASTTLTCDKELLDKLAKNLQHIRQTRIVLLINMIYEQNMLTSLTEFFKLCHKYKMINIMVLHQDFYLTHIYHSYSPFPHFQLEIKITHSISSYFPNRWRNMLGKVVYTLTDQMEPRTMLYTDAKGQQQMGGYVGKFMQVFSAYYNCKLQFPFNISNDRVIFLTELRQAARNETIDIASSMSSPQRENNIHEYPYTLEICRWYTMLPVEQPLASSELLLLVFSGELSLTITIILWLLSILLIISKDYNNLSYNLSTFLRIYFASYTSTLRGLLGQPFKMEAHPSFNTKLIYLLLFIAGLYISTGYQASLVYLLTNPPKERTIATFEDTINRNLKILLAEDERPHLVYYTGEEFWDKYKSAFTIVKTFAEFQTHRFTLDTNFGYATDTSVWPLFNEQQKYFSNRLFRLSTKLFYTNFVLWSLPVNENSYYKEPLSEMIFYLQAGGIMEYWHENTFYDMVALGRLSFEDLSRARIKEPLDNEDLFYCWVLYLVMLCLSVFVFLCEILFYKYKS
ncbi:uncharacterized protein LOC119675418, partial [Teleopsis dalmanni]|uniref:uncharacterized protein LOC119675418 n=1 Tax=Teleopsis dalmanni TaxID=139649 RepID=UPI0018CD84DC